MGLPPIAFTGFSEFSDEFQVVLERSFEVASLPVQQLQTEQTLLNSEQQALEDLASAVQDLEQRFVDLGLLGANSAVTASSTDTTVVTTTLTGAPAEASFDVDVTSAASAAQESSLNGLADNDTTSLSTQGDGTFSLTLDTTTTNIDLLAVGSGRTAGTTGSATPASAVAVRVDFSNGLTGSITADLASFVVSDSFSAGSGGDDLNFSFTGQGTPGATGSIDITTANGDGLTEVKDKLNTALVGTDVENLVSFDEVGGNLKLIVSDTAGESFAFTATVTDNGGSLDIGSLASGGTAGGHSAEEIAVALNAQGALDQTLVDAEVTFSALNGEVKVTGNKQFDVAGADFDQGTGFISGLINKQNVNLQVTGSGRAAGTTGSTTPASPVSVKVDFSNGVAGSITADLASFVVSDTFAAGTGGDQLDFTFTGQGVPGVNDSISIITQSGDTVTDIKDALNADLVGTALEGLISFDAANGNLKILVSDTAQESFVFTATVTDNGGGLSIGSLSGGGTVGGHSEEEIADALNAQVALNPTLVAAGVTFTAVSGEVQVSGTTSFDIAVTDNAQGAGFASGLVVKQTVAGFDDTLNGLRDFINANSSTLGVTASVINTSSDPDNPEYRLTVTATETGATTLALEDSAATDLLTETLVSGKQGTDAVFTIDGLPITNKGNTITDFLTGLSLTIVDAGQATVSVSKDRTALSNALADIAVDYNAVVAKIQEQFGEEAGILSGNIMVRQAQSTLRDVTSFTGSGNITSMVAIGLELDENGLLSLNSTTFDGLSDAELLDALTFIGDTTIGFAGNGRTLLKDFADPAIGQIQTALDLLEESDERLTKQIEEAQEQVDRLMENLEKQFAEADLLLSQIESQQSLLTELFDAFNRARDNS